MWPDCLGNKYEKCEKHIGKYGVSVLMEKIFINHQRLVNGLSRMGRYGGIHRLNNARIQPFYADIMKYTEDTTNNMGISKHWQQKVGCTQPTHDEGSIPPFFWLNHMDICMYIYILYIYIQLCLIEQVIMFNKK